MADNEGVKDILRRYEKRLGENLDFENVDLPENKVFSREYELFRKGALNKTDSFYENAARLFGNIIQLKLKPEDQKELENAIEFAHLHIKPSDALGFALFFGIAIIVFSLLLMGVSVIPQLMAGTDLQPMLVLPLLLMIFGVLVIKPLGKMPIYLSSKRRLAASNQMVVCILYMIIYMRHTSNLEHAVKFAGEHIGNPLAIDMRKIFWDVETDKYSTIKESIDNYLNSWKGYNLEFVESFHLIESSLYEPSDQKRITLLEKALEVMLDGTHERMLHFAHDLKSPMTILYMLGIVLPILGLVLFPLLGSFMSGMVKWYHLAILYNIILPIGVFVFGYNMLIKRPTGYSESVVIKSEEGYGQGAMFVAVILMVIFLFIGLMPIVLHFVDNSYDQYSIGAGVLEIKLLDIKCSGEGADRTCLGPYGVAALIMSMFIPVGLAISLGMYYKIKTREMMEIRKKTKNLEKEFIGSLFQLGNRVGGGIPVEIAFSRVSEDLKGTPTGDFFRMISVNLTKMGMGLKSAIFDSNRGAIKMFPSGLVDTSMRVLVESARRGPLVVSRSMISISEYVGKINNVNERLKDLLSDVTSSMKSQVSFMTPMIAGIVVGVSSMVVSIINKLTEEMANSGGSNIEGVDNLGGLTSLLRPEFVVPSYHFQLIVGFYVIEVIIILTYLGTAIENGIDSLAFKNALSKNLLFGMSLYFIISFIGVLVFTILAGGINIVSGG